MLLRSNDEKILLSALLTVSVIACADVRVPAIFSDFAVLQKSPSTAVFGKADPGEKVTVSYGDAKGTAVTGKDGKWFWADKATLDGTDVVVSSANVTDTVAVRYARQNNPTCNLYNGAGFPAVPFELKVK